MSRSDEVIERAMAFVAASRALRQRELERRAARKQPLAIALPLAARKVNISNARQASQRR